ncbi:MAG TPA: hypothetical protein VHX88_18955 [Solirubrobacteraceae bacterium]|nr:hypothetical protein [Solirubrobacteraceae bacterium]
MFASVRCYFVHRAPTSDLAEFVELEFADRIGGQPGFVSYAFVDSGDGEAMSVSVFTRPGEAAASRDLARRWTESMAPRLELTATESRQGELVVSRTAPELATATRGRHLSARRYRLRGADVGGLARIIDGAGGLADRVQALDGFLGYHVLDCSGGDVVSISIFRDAAAGAAFDALAAHALREDLSGFHFDRTEMLGSGELAVSRITPELLAPLRA